MKEQEPKHISRRDFLKSLAVGVMLGRSMLSAAPAVAQSETQSSPDIYYGYEPSPEEKAFSVMIQGNNGIKSSGSVIHPYVIATVLHGLNKDAPRVTPDPSDVWVYSAGDLNHTAIQAKQIIEIGKDTAGNDRALIILSQPFISDQISPIKIGDWDMVRKYPLFAMGHGRNETSNTSLTPRMGPQYFVPFRFCGFPSETAIATQNPEGSESKTITAKGDSGGPLYIYVPKGDPDYKAGFYVIGVLYGSCSSEDTIDENGNPNPLKSSVFQSLVEPKVKAEIEEVLASADKIVRVENRLPFIPNHR